MNYFYCYLLLSIEQLQLTILVVATRAPRSPTAPIAIDRWVVCFHLMQFFFKNKLHNDCVFDTNGDNVT